MTHDERIIITPKAESPTLNSHTPTNRAPNRAPTAPQTMVEETAPPRPLL